ncbi:hypothetical protein [Helicobacter pylori]|uniref:hypothetical protein n=1 Tax=Helicobacter pylori TaxID=210 RepID=UPI001C59922C|nr:hypothetical protein [Helicobacter pylori]
MWDEKIIKIIPAVLFLFCLLQIFELVLVVNYLNRVEKLEVGLAQNLEALEKAAILLNEHLNGMK